LLCLTHVIYGLFVLIWCIIMLQYSILNVFAPFIWHNSVKINMVFLVFWLILHVLWWIFKWKSLFDLFFYLFYIWVLFLGLWAWTKRLNSCGRAESIRLKYVFGWLEFFKWKKMHFYIFKASFPNTVFKQFLSLWCLAKDTFGKHVLFIFSSNIDFLFFSICQTQPFFFKLIQFYAFKGSICKFYISHILSLII